jgi:uncharacterized protein (DUF305 family)
MSTTTGALPPNTMSGIDDGQHGGGGDDDGEWDGDGDGESAGRPEPGRPAGSSGAVLLIRLVLVGLLVAVGVGAFLAFASGPATPADNSPAAGLARDMIDHHAQAVDMATIIQARTDDPEIRTLATDIALGQSNQMGQMQGWLNDWNLSIGRSGPPMAWMNAGDGMKMGPGVSMDPAAMRLRPDGLMPGMATQAQVNQLRTLPVKQADVLFLKLMIAHHQGGISMAQVALAETKVPVVVHLCQTIVTSQQGEITAMTQMLQQRT